jgi:hypothetical protein
MAKTGGVLTFCMIGAVVLALLLMLVGQQNPILGIVALLLYLAAFVMWFVVMIALKVTMDQSGYQRGGGIIWTIIALTVVLIVVGIAAAIAIGSQFAGVTDPKQLDTVALVRAFGIWGIILAALSLIYTIVWLLLGARLSDYGSMAGGAWKGAGIVLIIATAIGLLNWAIYIVVLLAKIPELIFVAGVLGFIAAILWLVAWILIGVGFMGDANRLAAAQAR